MVFGAVSSMYDNSVKRPCIGRAFTVSPPVSVLLNELIDPLATTVYFVSVIGTNERIGPVPS